MKGLVIRQPTVQRFTLASLSLAIEFIQVFIVAGTGLPSEPVDLVATTIQNTVGKVRLSWRSPEDTGGRADLTYHVTCERWEGSVPVPCEDRIRYEPGSVDLKESSVEVSQLEAHVNYSFSVEARSGVSAFSSQQALSSTNVILEFECKS